MPHRNGARSPVPALLLALAVLAAAPSAAPATELSDLSWLVGAWESRSEDGSSTEIWSPPEGGIMLGLHRDVRTGGRTGFEYLRIAEDDEGIVYWASPRGRCPATPFRLVETGPRRAVFANPDHDFPKRLVYWTDADGALHARAEGEDGEGPEWRWERAE